MMFNTQTISFQELFSMRNIILYFICINIFGFFIMWLDKRKAKKGGDFHEKKFWRKAPYLSPAGADYRKL